MEKSNQENRLANFRQIIKSVGGTNEAARIMDKKNSYITQIAGPNPKRSIGDKTAETIEAAFRLAPGTLDMPPPEEVRGGDTHMAELASVMVNTGSDDREIIIEIAKLFAKRALKTVKPADL